MTEQIQIELKKKLELPDQLFNVFWSKLKPAIICKGDMFLEQGEISRSLALVEKGAFYSFYEKDGNEIIEGFCFEGCFMTDYPSFIAHSISKKNFKALENSNILKMLNIDFADIAAVLWIAKLKKERFVHLTKNRKRSAAM